MSITKSLNFDKVLINNVDVSPHLSESAEVTIEPVDQMVRNNQTLPSAWDVSFSVDVLNDNVQNVNVVDVYTNSAAEPQLTNIVFEGVPGSTNLAIDNVIITATPNFEDERTAFTLTGTKRVTSLPTAITITTSGV